MDRYRLLSVGTLVVGLSLAVIVPVMAQPGPLMGNLPFNWVGARASAMGGAYIAVANDMSGAYWNPAGAVYGESVLPDVEVTVQSTGLGEVQDMITAGQTMFATTENFTIDDLDQLFPLVPAGGLNLGLRGAPFFGLNMANVGIHATGFVSGNFTLNATDVDPNDPTNQNYRQVRITSPGVLGIAQGGVSWAKGIGEWDVGVTVKTLAGVYAPGGTLTATAIDINDGTTYTLDQTGWGAVVTDQGPHIGVDIGVMKETTPGTRFGVVLRNVNSPTLFTGANRLRIQPSLDLGIMRQPKDNFVIAFDIHNFLGANNAPATMHIGMERRVYDIFKVRVGINNGIPTYGLGVDVGPAQVNLAVGSRVMTSTTIGFHLEF